MRKHVIRRSVALLLSILMLGQSAYAAEVINAYTPEYKYFETTDVPQEYRDQDLFWFGSTDMTVSENDPDYYVMRVLRSGSCDSDASITVKFTDVTADYGENYRVWTYDDHTEPESTGDAPAMVDFIQENMSTLTEEDAYTEEDLINAMESEDGVDLVDGLGDAIANLSLTDLTDDSAASEVSSAVTADAEAADGELDGVIDASDYTAIDSETESMYSDDYPGHELTLNFAAGETEKLIVVDPMYSSAADGNCAVTVSLKNPSEGMAYQQDSMTTSITITDEDPQTEATVSIEKTEYYADGDTVAVTINRTGSINNVVCVNLVTSSDEAEMGVDYQGADAKVYFPMGFTSRTVELQVNHIRDEELTFQVKLVNPVGCTLDNAEATVTIATADDAMSVALAEEEAAASGSTGLIPEDTAAAVTVSTYATITELHYSSAAADDEAAAAETTAAGEEAAAAETTAAGEEAAAAETTAAGEEAAAAETTAAGEEAAAAETTAAEAEAPDAAEAQGAAADTSATEAEQAPEAETVADAAETTDSDEIISEDPEEPEEIESDPEDITVTSDYSDVPEVDTEDTEAPEDTAVDDSAEAAAADEGAVELAGASSKIVLTGTELNRLGAEIHPSNFTKIGQGWIDGTGHQWYYSCKGVSYDTWNGIKYNFPNPYLYDGVRVRLDGDHNSWWSSSTTHISIDDNYLWKTDDNSYGAVTVDAMFTKNSKNTMLKVEALTSYWNGIHGTIYYVKPIYRKFNFQLANPEDYALSFAGTDSAAALKYTATDMNAGTYSIGDQLIVKGTDANGYVKLYAVEFQDSDGNVLYTAYNNDSSNVNSMSITLTSDALNAMATDHTTYKKDSSTGCFVGQIIVKPIYQYIDANVTIQTSQFGQFNGDYTVTANTTKTFHLGDQITLSSTVFSSYDGKYVVDGVGYQKYAASGDVKPYASGRYDYLTDNNTTLTVTIDAPQMTLYPAFTGANNAVEVHVKRSDVSKLKADSLLLKYSRTIDEDNSEYYIYTITEKSVHVDTLVQLSAEASDSSKVPLWTVGGQTWSGNAFAFTTSRDKSNNIIYLTLGTAASYSMYGYAYNGDRNLSMLNSISEPTIPASNAAVTCADVGAYPDDNGYFTVSGVTGSPNTRCRIVIYCDNAYTIKDVELTGSEINLGNLQTSVNTLDTARFTGVTVTQNGSVVSSIGTLALDSKKLVLSASVADGNTYLLNNKEYTETATGVTFYILDGTTHAIKYELPASRNQDGSWSAEIEKFSPDQPDSWYYGDLVYAELTTDRIQGAGLDDDGNVVVDIPTTTYAMLSTGYMIVYSDEELDAQTISFDPKVDADSVLGSDAVVAEDTGSETTARTTKTFTNIPFLGGLNALLGVTGGYISWGKRNTSDPASQMVPDLDDDVGGDVAADDTSSSYKQNHSTKVQVKITVSIEDLPYGGERLKIGVVAYTGNAAALNAAASNPYAAYKASTPEPNKASSNKLSPELIYADREDRSTNLENLYKGTYGTPRMTVSVQVGIYIDFGLVSTISDESGEVESSTGLDCFRFLGIGGYFGLSGSIEYQWPFVGPFAIPMYAGVIGSASVVGYVGGTANLNEALNYTKPFEAITDEDGNFDLGMLDFNVDVIAQAGIKGYVGVGLADILGGRVILGLGVAYEYCPSLKNYYAAIDDSWGMTINFTLGGQIDLILVSIPLSGFSIPLTSQGFSEYFTYVRRSYRLWDYIHEELEENSGAYNDDQIATLNSYMDLLVDDMNNADSTDKLLNDYNDAYDYASGVGALSSSDKVNLTMITDFDVWTLEDDGSGNDTGSTSNTQTVNEDGYMVMQHTDSTWVANDSAALSASFTEAATKTLVEDSYSQPTASMVDIGNNKLLSIYLSDTSGAGEAVVPTLVYTIYDASADTWTDPQPVYGDGTADYTPSLCDAGDQVVITWSSAGTVFTSDNAKDVLESMDIWEVTFDKNTLTLGTPVQLTKDSYMDFDSSAIYDDETGDIAVYYVKSAVTNSTDLLNYVTGNSILCYRLYDGAKKSWLIDYTSGEYSTMTAEELTRYGTMYGGQRFMSSAVANDEPIKDLTVCTGYNGLGIYAYTVDTDGDDSDNTDTELYMQVFDFRTYKTYAPIRITNDSVSQAEPQLVRTSGSYTDTSRNSDGTAITVEGATYLFWLEDDDTVNYINVTDLLRHGIDADGKLTDSALDYAATPIDFTDTDGVTAAVSNYQALTDDDNNLYLIWSQAVESTDEDANEDLNTPAPQEVFASALIQEVPESTYNADTGDGGSAGSSWSDPVRMTTSESHNDGVSGIISSDGNLYIMHTQYDITYVGFADDAEIDPDTGCIEGNPYEIGDTDLCFSSFTPVASIEATEFTYSDDTPTPGDFITVSVKLENTGLTTAKGYSASFAESRNGIAGEPFEYCDSTLWIPAGSSDTVEVDWYVPEDFDQVSLVCSATEEGYNEPVLSYSEPLEKTDSYEVSIGSVAQTGNTFSVDYTLTNTGSCTAADGTVLRAEFAGLYGSYSTVYGLDTDYLGELNIAGLAPGETKTGTLELQVPEKAFDYCGYDAVELTVFDSDSNALSEAVSSYMVLESPIGVSLTGSDTLKAGETAQLTATMDSKYLQERGGKVIYTSSDNSVASVSDDGVVTAVGSGTATITATFYPYGKDAELQITVDIPDGWNKLNGKWYYYKDNTAQTGWLLDPDTNKWYYLGSDGVMQSGWQKINGKWYYLNNSMKTGWQKVNGYWYYLGTGAMQSGWQKIDGKWYYLNNAMKTGWLSWNGNWYYLSNAMVTGWKQINSKWYYFNTNGTMVSSCTMTINGKSYTFDSHGVWQQS